MRFAARAGNGAALVALVSLGLQGCGPGSSGDRALFEDVTEELGLPGADRSWPEGTYHTPEFMQGGVGDVESYLRQALVNENADLIAQDAKYVMRITGDSPEGKAELDNFILPEKRYPVLVTTSKLLNTGVDAQTCKLIVIDQRIESMTSECSSVPRL